MSQNEPLSEERREVRRSRNGPQPGANDVSMRSRKGRWGTLISLTALLFSGISLYETVLKQPMPTVYISGTMRFGHDTNRSAVFALPLTIFNHGPRDTVVTGLTLTVANPGSAGENAFAATHFGDTPRRTDRLFSPVPIAGHSAFAASVIFTADGPQAAASLDHKGSYKFCLSIRTETGDSIGILSQLLTFRPSHLGFRADIPYLDASQLAAGQHIAMHVQDVRRFPGAGGVTEAHSCEE
jgi:hypothetical protein